MKGEDRRFRVDEFKHVAYYDNIPVGRKCSVALMDGDTVITKYMILALNQGSDCWYHGRFIGTEYTVIKSSNHGWHQVCRWYKKIGFAERAMMELAEGLITVDNQTIVIKHPME